MASLTIGYEVFCGEGHLLISAKPAQSKEYWARKCKEESNTEYVFIGNVPFETETRLDRNIAELVAKRAAIKFDPNRVYTVDNAGDIWFDVSILQESAAQEAFFNAIVNAILWGP